MSDMVLGVLAVVVALVLYALWIVPATRILYPFIREQLQTRRNARHWAATLVRAAIFSIVVTLIAAVAMELILWPMGAFTIQPTVARVLQAWAFLLALLVLSSLISIAIYAFVRKRAARQ